MKSSLVIFIIQTGYFSIKFDKELVDLFKLWNRSGKISRKYLSKNFEDRESSVSPLVSFSRGEHVQEVDSGHFSKAVD